MAHDDEREMREALRLEPFFQGGLSRLVKVLALPDGIPSSVGGYVTQEKFLLGQIPVEIEKALGMRFGSLQSGCRVFRPLRQPGPSQVVYELTTKNPDGLAHTALSDQRFLPSTKAFIHQWRLTTQIPVTLLCQLGPNTRYRACP
jgi:hypothetical protein